MQTNVDNKMNDFFKILQLSKLLEVFQLLQLLQMQLKSRKKNSSDVFRKSQKKSYSQT